MEALHENTQLAFVDDVIRGRYECLQQLTKYPVKELEVVRFHLRLSASRLAPDSHWNKGDRERMPGLRIDVCEPSGVLMRCDRCNLSRTELRIGAYVLEDGGSRGPAREWLRPRALDRGTRDRRLRSAGHSRPGTFARTDCWTAPRATAALTRGTGVAVPALGDS